MNRLQRIQDLRWEVDSQIPETTLNNFGEEEGSFLVQYDQILNNYMEEIEMNVTQVISNFILLFFKKNTKFIFCFCF